MSTSSSTEAQAGELAGRIAAGDRGAEQELVVRYQRGLRLFLARKTQGDLQLADDLCQETLIVTIERLRREPLGDPDKLAGYIHGIAKRIFVGDIRKTARRRTDADSERIQVTAGDDLDPVEHLTRLQCREIVRQLIDEMDVPRDRELLVRAFLCDQEKSEICAALNLEHRHYDRVKHRAKQRLKELIDRQGAAATIASLRPG